MAKTFLILFLIFFAFVNCDFSSQLHKEIIRAQTFIHEQKYKEAIEIYNRVLNGHVPEKIHAKILYQLGDIYSIHLGEVEKSAYYYSKIKEVTSETEWLIKIEERLGEIYYSYLSNYELASRCYKNLVNYYPYLKERDSYQFRLGHSYLELKQYDESLKVFNEISKNQNHQYYESSFFYIAKNYFNQKKWTDSVDNIRKYLKLESRQEKTIDAKFFLGNVYETMEELEKAYDVYYSLLGEYPNTSVLKNRLKSLYTRRILRKR